LGLHPPLILASSSPRRRELLKRAGYQFEVVSTEVKERVSAQLSLRELTIANATRKALALGRKEAGAVILAADTLVSLEGEILGKPRNIEDARAILQRLNGRTHKVCTAVFIIAPSKYISFADVSRVKFRRLSKREIDNYIADINPLDKAGAYAAQGVGSRIIESIEGSVSNVIGLPMERTTEALKQFGIVAQLERV
jgi:septum formation protein